VAENLKPQKSRDDYRLLASSYSFWEYLALGKQLQRARFSHWRELQNTQRVLLLGDGNGRFSTHLLKEFPTIRIWSLDSSEAMLNAAARRRRKNNLCDKRITPINGDVLTWNPQGLSFDAVVAQFFFDGFDRLELQNVCEILKKVLTAEGILLVSEFHIPPTSVLAVTRARITLWSLYKIFWLLTGLKNQRLTPHEPMLCECGFEVRKTATLSQGTVLSQVFQRKSTDSFALRTKN
jgi:ubiquinone/menaquinone biosynthesis C-methylase UbiE